jgi:hypothetical protein
MELSHRLKAALGAGLLLALAACGGSDSGGNQAAAATGSSATGATGAPDNSGQIASDSFLSQVVAINGASSDATEPGGIDSITATTSDTTEPFSIM